MLTIVDRYLLREVALTFSATVTVLLAMVLSYRLARYLSQATQGLLAQDAIWSLLGLQAVRFLVILIPLASLIAIMLALGRLYRDNEMTALCACGIGPLDIYRPLLLFALPMAITMTILSLYLVPQSQDLQYQLREQARKEAELTMFTPGTFRSVAGGQHVVYIGSLGEQGKTLQNVFVRSLTPEGIAVTTAVRGYQKIDLDQGVRYLVLENGSRYQPHPNGSSLENARADVASNDYDLIRFETLTARIDRADIDNVRERREAIPTGELLNSEDPRLRAELQQRLSGPVSLLIIVLLAPLLAHANPREGRYGRIVAGLLVYTIYVNLLGVGDAWLERNQIWPELGLWWVHAIFLLLTFGLWLYQSPPQSRKRRRAIVTS